MQETSKQHMSFCHHSMMIKSSSSKQHFDLHKLLALSYKPLFVNTERTEARGFWRRRREPKRW